VIDLTRAEQQMLAEIEARPSPRQVGAPGTPDSPAPEDAQFVVRGGTPDQMLPMLMETFSRYFASVPGERVFAELSHLVKKGLGNAYKWGNEGDPNRTLTVRAIMTHKGAVVAIVDEGKGFEVAEVLGQFLHNDAYFRHGGSGFSHFHGARSIVSYADGGRTLLIRFLCEPETVSSDETGARSSSSTARRHIALTQLGAGSQVKVKGNLRSDGHFYAEKVGVKAAEEWAVMDGVIREIEENERRIHLLNAAVRLPESVEIISPEQRRLGFGSLHVCQVVELTGSYSSEDGFLALKVQIRHDSAPQFEEIQGRVEEVSETEGTFRVLGITVTTDGQTEIRDKRPVHGAS
jgi:anti-sigma regulatory factor (Ser/Thr protein kinase)